MNMENFSTILNFLEQYHDSERPALICAGESLSYRQLLADAKQIARGLVAEGLRKGDRVLFLMRSSADAFRALFGILYAGGVYVAADPEWPEERLQFVAEDGQTVYTMTDQACARLRERAPAAAKLPEVRGEDEAAVYYTSGSTGQPKGVVLHHLVFGTTLPDALAPPANWSTAQIIFRLSFVASIMDSCYALTRGNTIVFASDQERNSIEQLAASMERHQVDCIAGSASIFLRYLAHPDFARVFSGLRFVSLGAERADPSVVARLSELTAAELYIHYASSEMFLCAEYHYRRDGQVHLGKAAWGAAVYLLDEGLEEVPPGQTGELFIGGISGNYGRYLNLPELNAEKYVVHPRFGRLFRTGDLARLEPDGEITILGRMDGMVKLHGQRIELAEIENAIGNYPGVRRAAVRLIGEAPYERLAAYFSGAEELSEAELRRYLAGRLPYYMVPSLFMKLDNMPENANGKLDYRALPPIDPPRPEYAPPETPREKLLCEIFGQVLKTDGPVSVNESFLALGGDSISAMVAASRLRKRGFSFEARWLFVAPTARQLAPMLIPVTEEAEPEEPDLPPELTPGQRAAIQAGIGWEAVECVYPVTRVVREKLAERAPYLVYGMWEIEAGTVNPEDLKRRLAEMTAKHQALRSVFLCPEGEAPLQVVLRTHTPALFCVDLRGLAEGEGLSPKQKAYFRNLIRLDAARPKDLEREVLFRVGLVRISQTKSILFLAYSHLLLDGAGTARILQELMEPVKIYPDRELWRRRMIRLYHRDHSASLDYWKKLLEGCHGWTALPMKAGEAGALSPETFYAAGGKGLYAAAAAWCRARQVTVAALLHYAFGRALMALQQVDEVCFCSEGNGRTAEDAELAGMFVLRFPVRLSRGDSLTDCQAQLLTSAAHFHVWGILEPAMVSGWERCHGVLNVQNIFAEQGKARQVLGAAAVSDAYDQARDLEKLVLLSHAERERWFLRVSLDEALGLSCSTAYNGNRYGTEPMRELTREFLRQLHGIVKGED